MKKLKKVFSKTEEWREVLKVINVFPGVTLYSHEEHDFFILVTISGSESAILQLQKEVNISFS